MDADKPVEVRLRGIQLQRDPEALGDLTGVRAKVVEAEYSVLKPPDSDYLALTGPE
jgi:hypothetical protein